MTVPAILHVATIPRSQREALAWRLRDLLHEADHRAATWGRSSTPHLAEVARCEYLRGELLGMVAELEGASRLLDGGELA